MSATFSRPIHATAAALLTMSFVLLLSASPVTAQQSETMAVTAADDQASQPSGSGTTGAFWELIGGFEADTHGSAYAFFGPGYVHPIRPGLAWTARAFVNYLAYEFTGATGETDVRSPGFNAAAGVRFGDRSWLGVFAGPEVKWRRTEVTLPGGQTLSDSDAEVGANVGAEVYANPTSHNNLHGIVNYGTVDKYTWARLGFKEQVTNRNWQGSSTAYVGVEGIVQGNDDIRSTQVGGFVEFLRVPANLSLTFRLGYKRSTFDMGPNKTGPYFGAGFYKRLG